MDSNRKIWYALMRWIALGAVGAFWLVLGVSANSGVSSERRPRISHETRVEFSADHPGSSFQRRRKSLKLVQACLPPDVKGTDLTMDVDAAGTPITVAKKLSNLHARCTSGRLLDSSRREIRFVRLLCWGNPPADADELLTAQQHELTELRKTFNVILLRCDPRTE